MADALDAGRCDVAVGPLPSETNAHVEVLGQEEVVVIASAGHRFSQTAGVRMEALSDEPFVHFSPDSGMALWVDQLAADHEVMLDVALRTRCPHTAAQLAAAGMGVTIVPVSALPARPAGVVRRLRPMVKRDVGAMVAALSDILLS